MPSHRVHRKFAKLLLGRAYPEIDRLLDFPYVIYRSKHRKLFHDPKTVAMILLLTKDMNKAMAAALHIALDKLESRKRLFKLLQKLF